MDPERNVSCCFRGKHHNQLCWVLELIDQHSNSWNMESVNELFHPPDVDEILKLKLPLRGKMALWLGIMKRVVFF